MRRSLGGVFLVALALAAVIAWRSSAGPHRPATRILSSENAAVMQEYKVSFSTKSPHVRSCLAKARAKHWTESELEACLRGFVVP
jgi:hypothetical protein